MNRSTTLSASVRIDGDRHELREAGPSSPEWHGAELLVAGVASAYAAELAAAAARLDVPVDALEVDARGHLTERRDDRYAFVAIELDVVVDADEALGERVQLAAEIARDRCPVTAILDVPLSLAVETQRSRLQEVAP